MKKPPKKPAARIALAGTFQIGPFGLLASNFAFDPADAPEAERRRLVLDYALMAIDGAINDKAVPVHMSGGQGDDVDQRR
jgi:hypothetical protein